jgi:L-asparaginase
VKKILILHTGGTIGMAQSAKGDKALKPSALQTHFLELVPELKQLAEIKTLVLSNIDSSNVTPHHWVEWLAVLKGVYSAYDGFVITHGTDTMAYTGAALSFALRHLSKPVVLTGSQRPLTHIRSDARENLINSVEVACHGPREVSICFGNELLRANRTTKFSATDYVAFESFNFPLLAKMGVRIEKNWQRFSKTQTVKNGTPQWLSHFDMRVFCFKIFPGISAELLLAAICNENCRGIVLEAYGSGNMPSIDTLLIKMIAEGIKLEKPVVIVSQCPHGQVDLKLYESGIKLKEVGALSAGDMTMEASVVKLMHGLGLGLTGHKLKSYFSKNICGERSH